MSAVTERLRAVGSWEVLFRGMPQDVVARLDLGGHIVVTPVAEPTALLGDAVLSAARYSGVVRMRRHTDGGLTLRGPGIAWWLGDEDGGGPVAEQPIAIAPGTSFENAIRQALPTDQAVIEGTLHPNPGKTVTGTRQWETARQTIDYISDTAPVTSWRVNPDGTLDAGTDAQLYATTPRAVIARRGVTPIGRDLTLTGFDGAAQVDIDLEKFATRIVVLGKVEDAAVVQGTADIASGLNPYRNLRGQPLRLTRLLTENTTEGVNAGARAQAALGQRSVPERALTLDTGNYDLVGACRVGDQVWVYDPGAGVVDTANQVPYLGGVIYPASIQVTAMTWPLKTGMGVYYRSRDGAWVDLTAWVDWLDGQTTIEVGRSSRDLISTGSSPVTQVPDDPANDTTTPGQATLAPTFGQNVYTSASGEQRVEITVTWTPPATNTDGSAFTDADHYEIRYRTAPYLPSTWDTLASVAWDALGSWDEPLPQPQAGGWQVAFAPADVITWTVRELTPAIRYEFQVRPVDSATPTPHAGAWSTSRFVYADIDNVPPGTPGPGEASGSVAQISVLHRLGLSTGGTFNLPADLAYLDVHAVDQPSDDPDTTPDSFTRLGKIVATRANIIGQIPVIGTFPATSPDQKWVRVYAVDTAGNRSATPSVGVPVTAQLVDDLWVGSLVADKIVGGEFRGSYFIGGEFVAGDPNGRRTRQSGYGFEAFKQDPTQGLPGGKFFDLDIAREQVSMIGTMQVGTPTDLLVIQPNSGTGRPEIVMNAVGPAATGAYLNAIPVGASVNGTGLNSGSEPATGSQANAVQGTVRLYPTLIDLFINTAPGNTVDVNRRRGAYFSGSQTRAEMGLTQSTSETKRSEVACVGDDIFGYAQNNINLESLNSAGDRDGGFLWLGAGNNGNIFFGKKTTTQDMYVAIEASGTIVGVVNGTYIWKAVATSSGDNGRLEGICFTGLNNSHFSGGINGGGFFAIRKQSGASDPILDADGLSPRFVKNFVINHPTDRDRWLVHACTETPEAAVEYSGVTVIHGWEAEVQLPAYFEAATHVEGRQVWLQVMLPDVGLHRYIPRAIPSFPRDGKFQISSDADDGTRVSWRVKAIRKDVPALQVEPRRDEVIVGGTGPYRYLIPRTNPLENLL